MTFDCPSFNCESLIWKLVLHGTSSGFSKVSSFTSSQLQGKAFSTFKPILSAWRMVKAVGTLVTHAFPSFCPVGSRNSSTRDINNSSSITGTSPPFHINPVCI